MRPTRQPRRTFLQRSAGAVAALAAAGVARPVEAQQELPWTALGFSQGGLPLIVHRLGDGPRRILILGGQHGAPEANTIKLTQALMADLTANRADLPLGVGVDFLPITNPDGAASGSRQYLSGVDPNRNWDGPDWRTDAYDSNAQFVPGLGGPRPFSEQETRALADWILANPPMLIINFHSAGGFMFGNREGPGARFTQAFAEATGYRVPTPGAGSPLPYRATGSMGAWQRTVGVDGIFVELSTPWDPEIARNVEGVRAVLRAV
ncbi:MAG: M14 family metallopeptidase [Chloroflexota bacterium]